MINRLLMGFLGVLICVAPVALLLFIIAGRIYFGGHGLIGGFEMWHIPFAGLLISVSAVGGFFWGWDLKKPRPPQD